MKKLLLIFMCSVMTLHFTQSATSVDIWTANSYINVFKDFIKEESSSTRLDLVVAKNEYESYQILLRGDNPFVIQGVDFTDLISEKEKILSSNLSFNYLEYVYISKNSVERKPENLVRWGEGYYPDPLSNESEINVEGGETQSIWITLYVPVNTRPGLYKGTALVRTSVGNYPVEITVEVNNVTIPNANESDFDIMHHQQIAGTWFYDATRRHHPQDVIVQIYGHERWTPEWWELVNDMADNMRRSRMNVLFVNTQQLLLDAPGTQLKKGKFIFDWSKFDEYIQFFIDKKAINKMEGLHLGSTIGVVGETFKSYILTTNKKGELCSSNVEPMSKPCRLFHNQFLGALYEHLKEKGWLEMWIQHIGDEAVSELQHKQYAYYMEKLKSQAPDMQCGDPTFSLESAKNAVAHGATLVTPLEDLYQLNKPAFDTMQINGVKIYGYNCCGPHYSWLNRLIDHPVWHQRQLGWLSYKWRLSGWLHWGWNFWVDWFQNKLHEIDEEAFKGDHYSVYPDVSNNKIKSSIRMNAIRDMGEEYELLRMLGNKNPELALKFIDKVTPDGNEGYISDTETLNATRNELIRACAIYAQFE